MDFQASGARRPLGENSPGPCGHRQQQRERAEDRICLEQADPNLKSPWRPGILEISRGLRSRNLAGGWGRRLQQRERAGDRICLEQVDPDPKSSRRPGSQKISGGSSGRYLPGGGGSGPEISPEQWFLPATILAPNTAGLSPRGDVSFRFVPGLKNVARRRSGLSIRLFPGFFPAFQGNSPTFPRPCHRTAPQWRFLPPQPTCAQLTHSVPAGILIAGNTQFHCSTTR